MSLPPESRLRAHLDAMREAQRRAFVAYVCAGDPHLEATSELVPALAEAGVDVIELGIPYSDPMADGPAIQSACERALAAGCSVSGVLNCVSRIRERTQVPIIAFTYVNPVLSYGVERFAADAVAAGIDGLLVLDLPPEEDPEFFAQLRAGGLANVCLVAPNTEQSRRRTLAAQANGFVYYICRFGVTGERTDLPDDLSQQIAAIRSETTAPVCIGFGISSPEMAAEAAKHADGVVVGSHLVRLIERESDNPDMVSVVAERAAALAHAVHEV